MDHSTENNLNFFDVMTRIDKCTAEDVKKFRAEMPPEAIEIFENVDETKKLVLTVLNELTPEQIKSMRESMREYPVGIHTLGNDLQLLSVIRELIALEI